MYRGRLALCLLTLAALAGATAAGSATPTKNLALGTLDLRAELDAVSQLGAPCPPGVFITACAARTGEGMVAGLGRVTQAYTFLANLGPPTCSADDLGKALAYPVSLVVAGKGEIRLDVAEGTACVGSEQVRTQTQFFRITGGTGAYQGASGSGTVERSFGADTPSGRPGQETWTGTLVVPGLEFDVTPPSLSGAKGKTVRAPRKAKSVRVTYKVTASDAVDGAVPAVCRPGSGSRFKPGRTAVTCSAIDSSANAAKAKFTVTVTRRR